MKEVFIACTMLSMPVAAALVLGKTAGHMMGMGAAPALSAEAEAGRAAFARECAACHGPFAEGTRRGPTLLHPAYAPDRRSDAHIRAPVRRGAPERLWEHGPMPAIGGVSEPELAAIVAYIREMQAAEGIGG
jgi:mono/diheme cytochrome c family protein